MAERGSIAMKEHDRVVHHSHVARYVIVWLALLVFTFGTYGASRFHIPGGWGVLVALAIAVAKGALVALFFMHLWDQAGANRLVFATSLIFVALLIVIVLSDNATRFALANPPGSRRGLPAGASDYATPEPPPPASPRRHEGQGR
ncbi:MAG TPA: cytochrome C oxidase subunit IV family protein [Anaeromyxobacter sp.]